MSFDIFWISLCFCRQQWDLTLLRANDTRLQDLISHVMVLIYIHLLQRNRNRSAIALCFTKYGMVGLKFRMFPYLLHWVGSGFVVHGGDRAWFHIVHMDRWTTDQALIRCVHSRTAEYFVYFVSSVLWLFMIYCDALLTYVDRTPIWANPRQNLQ